jgi:hypothetical protein
MAQVRLINRFGNVVGWNKVAVRLFGRQLEGITELEYDDEVERELVYGAGRDPIGKGEGNYKPKASITLTEEEKRALMDSIPPGMRIQDIPNFDIIVTYTYENRVYKDVIRNAGFLKNGVSVKQGDKSIATKFDLDPTHIDWNV